MTVITIVIGALGILRKNPEKRMEKQKSEQKLRLSGPQRRGDQLEYLEESKRPEETYCHFVPSGKTAVRADAIT